MERKYFSTTWIKVDFDLNEQGFAIGIYKALGTFPTIANHSNPIEKNEEHYHVFDWFIKYMKNYANFNGRARRKEY